MMAMKTAMNKVGRLIAGILWLGGSLIECSDAAPVDLSAPANTLGYANLNGNARVWRELGEIDFGKGLAIPLRIEFDSGRDRSSALFGMGWWCPAMESIAFLKREKALQVNLPCGKTMYLRRDKSEKTRFISPDGEWIASVVQQRIFLYRNDGWLLTYVDGRLTELRTDEGRRLVWRYSNGIPVDVKEVGSPSVPLAVLSNSKGAPEALMLNGLKCEFNLGNRPRVTVMSGTRLVEGLYPALVSLNIGGSTEKFEYGVSSELSPFLEIHEQTSDILKLEWDPQTKLIVSDGEWKYIISPRKAAYDVPRIDRYKEHADWEFIDVDNLVGRLELRTKESGHVVRQVFKTKGPLYGKLKSEEKIEHGLRRLNYKANYDEKGRLLRETRRDGSHAVFEYDPAGELLTRRILPTRDPELLKEQAAKEGRLVEAVKVAKNSGNRDHAMYNLGSFYVNEVRDTSKVEELVKSIKNDRFRYALAVSSVNRNEELSAEEKILRFKQLIPQFPWKKSQLQFLITHTK